MKGLQAYIQEDGKIHTRFVQNLTPNRSSKLSRSNLQNIPIRTKEGRRIRYALLPEHDIGRILSSDILKLVRVLYIAGDKHMIEAFKNNVDIHHQYGNACLWNYKPERCNE